MEPLKRITRDPAVMGDKPCIRGLHVTVGTIVGLVASGHTGPSVVQVRTQDVTPTHLKGIAVTALKEHEAILEVGAVIVIDEFRSRARILPLRK